MPDAHVVNPKINHFAMGRIKGLNFLLKFLRLISRRRFGFVCVSILATSHFVMGHIKKFRQKKDYKARPCSLLYFKDIRLSDHNSFEF